MFSVELSRRAESNYSWLMKYDRRLFDRIRTVLEGLKLDPFLGKALGGEFHGRYSCRVGSYRIIYEIIRQRLIVHVLDIGHRREIYRGRH